MEITPGTTKLLAQVRTSGDDHVLRTISIKNSIGGGGMSTVFLGVDEEFGTKYAVKVFEGPIERSRPDGRSPTLVSRFRRESRILSRVSHPNIIEYRGYGEREDGYFFLMELGSGPDLADRLQKIARARGCLVEVSEGLRFQSPEEVVTLGLVSDGVFLREDMLLDTQKIETLARGILSALIYLHELAEPIIHRDMKPENVLVNDEWIPKLTDFGISKIVGGSQTCLTQMGSVMGTPAYISPEQFNGSEITVRSDVFSFGVMLFEMITALRLGADCSARSGLYAIVGRRICTPFYDPAVYVHNVPERLRQAVVKATQLKPENRFADAREMYGFLFPAKVEETQAPAPTSTPVPPAPTISRIPTVLATPTECANMVRVGGAPPLSTPPSVPVIRPAPTTISLGVAPHSTRVFVSPSKAPEVPAMVLQKKEGSFLGTIIVIAFALMIIVLGGVLIFNKGDVSGTKEDVTSGLRLLGSGVSTAKSVVEQVTTAMTSDESPVPLPEAPAQRFDFSPPSSSSSSSSFAPSSPPPASPLGDKATENVPAVGDTIASLKAEERRASTASEFDDLAKRYTTLGDTSASKRCASVAKALRNPRHSR